MLTGWAVTVVAALGTGPYAFGPSGSYAGMPIGEVTSSGVYGNPHSDQLYPYESQQQWLHGYYQEIPAYGGHHDFKPYNYKHLLSQSQTAAGFGMSPVMPYSQQFWHRYENRANFQPYANEPGVEVPLPMPYGVPSAAVPQAPRREPAAVTPPDWNAGPMILPAQAEVESRGPAPRTTPNAQAGGRWSGYQPPSR